jgi:phosphohistidine phosphatase SixA
MPLILVRHASAGDRKEWSGDDSLRPLDARGRQQAEELVARLAPFPIAEIRTSPAARCVQTVEPLAAARGLPLVLQDELTERRQADEGAALLRSLAGGDVVVVCGHGGLEWALPEPRKWRKGSAFALDDQLRIVDEV